jgi:N-acetylglucosamine-6-phosphate deacetylase
MHHRDPGPLPAFLADDRVTIEIVLDGIHVQKPVVNLAVRSKKPAGVCVITDNMRYAGIEPMPKTFERMGKTLTIEGGVPLNEDGVISGSLLMMNRALKNVIAFTGLELDEALVMLTATPARAARVGNAKGQLKVGYDADVVIFDEDFDVHRTLVGGETVYNRDAT